MRRWIQAAALSALVLVAGRWVRSLVLPPRTVLLDIGPDRALVARRDNLDVQLEVYGLVESG